MTRPNIAIIIGATRETRFADKPAAWLLENAQKRDDMSFELVDLRDFDLPLFDEVASNLWVPSSDERAVAWQNKIAEFHTPIYEKRQDLLATPDSLTDVLREGSNKASVKAEATIRLVREAMKIGL